MTRYLSEKEALEILSKDLEERIAKGEQSDTFIVPNKRNPNIRYEFHALRNGNLLEIKRAKGKATCYNLKAGKEITADYEIAAAFLKEGNYTQIVREIMDKADSKTISGNPHEILKIPKEDVQKLNEMFKEEAEKARKELLKIRDSFKTEPEN